MVLHNDKLENNSLDFRIKSNLVGTADLEIVSNNSIIISKRYSASEVENFPSWVNLVLYKFDFSTMPTPEYCKIYYRQRKAEKEKYREEHQHGGNQNELHSE